jgi:hypothetical protein
LYIRDAIHHRRTVIASLLPNLFVSRHKHDGQNNRKDKEKDRQYIYPYFCMHYLFLICWMAILLHKYNN